MSLSIDAEKALHKIQHAFMIKISQQTRIRRGLNLINDIYKNTLANVILSGERLNIFLKEQEKCKDFH